MCTTYTHIYTLARHQLNSHMVGVIIVIDNWNERVDINVRKEGELPWRKEEQGVNVRAREGE